MKVIIAGSRTINNIHKLLNALEKCPFCDDIKEIVSGTAQGVDKLGEQYAKGLDIPIKQFPANWKAYGRSAGFIRNCEMAEYADALIAVWDGKSRGTKHMIDKAKELKLKVFVFVSKG